jgi:uncharacterized membrane protein
MTTSRTSVSAPAKPLSPALDTTFKIGLVLKGLDGILEVAGGVLLLFLSPHAIQHLVRVLTAHELSEDPRDLIARHLLHSTAHLSTGITIFGAVYLLSHGVAKIVLVGLVMRDKLWAYPWLIALLLAFIVYQLYRITAVHFSIGLTLLTVFDAFLVWLTWREYRAKRDRRHQARANAAAQSSPDQPAEWAGQERAAKVVSSAAASGAGEQPAQQQASRAHGLPDQAESAEHPARDAVGDMRLGDGGERGVVGGGAGSAAHQRGQPFGRRGDAGEHETAHAAPSERCEDDDGAAGASGRLGQRDRAGEGADGDGCEQPVSAPGGVQGAGGKEDLQGAGRPGVDHTLDWPSSPPAAGPASTCAVE